MQRNDRIVAEVISSPQNQWLKRFRTALSSPGAPLGGWIAVEGPRLVEEALETGLEISAILATDIGIQNLEQENQANPLTSFRGRLLRVSDRIFASVSGTESPQGLAALLRPRDWQFDDLVSGGVPLIVALAGVQDPGNVGTVIRSAEAFGATGVVALRGTAHPLSAKALRASAGSALRIPMLAGIAPPVALAQFRSVGLQICAAHSGAAISGTTKSSILAHDTVDFRVPVVIIVGSEGAGIPPDISRTADQLVQIPISSSVESLNAATAASIILFEASRQRACLADTIPTKSRAARSQETP
ncbi:MAG: TrmH family RNA methyltransferase [Candidatus Acidiferrales bacterium]